MPSVWTRPAEELHQEYVANTEAFYRAAGRSLSGELDNFIRSCALGLWKNSSAVTQSEVDAYNALYSKGRSPGDALLWDLTSKVCSARSALPPMFFWNLAERDAASGRDYSRVFVRMVTNILLTLCGQGSPRSIRGSRRRRGIRGRDRSGGIRGRAAKALAGGAACRARRPDRPCGRKR